MRKPKYWAVKCTKENRERLEKLLDKFYGTRDRSIRVGAIHGYYQSLTNYTLLTIEQAEHFFLKGFDVWFEDNTAYHAETEEQANWILKEADRQGYKWSDGRSYIGNNNWHEYYNKTCYAIRWGGYSSREFWIQYGYKIIPVSSLMPDNIQKEQQKESELISLIKDHFKKKHEELDKAELEIIKRLGL